MLSLLLSKFHSNAKIFENMYVIKVRVFIDNMSN
jgi:hypothetical protein